MRQIRSSSKTSVRRATRAKTPRKRTPRKDVGAVEAVRRKGVDGPPSRQDVAYQRGLRVAPLELHLGQKVPDASEVDTSGPIRRKIRRRDPEFASLEANNNPMIVFKDEEGTGADRMMTPKLADKLDALADLVAAEWPGVKLRVTEAWDENDEHASGSLHYEGRAADLTTSPIDGTKLGRLAGLAVQAELHWVFYENALHVHVSMKR